MFFLPFADSYDVLFTHMNQRCIQLRAVARVKRSPTMTQSMISMTDSELPRTFIFICWSM